MCIRDRDDTPLSLAVRAGFPHIVKLLIDGGANVNSVMSLSDSPLHDAAMHPSPRVEMCQLLLDGGACADARNDCGKTPLSLAAESPCYEVLDLLIRHGCNVNNSDRSVLVKLFVPLFHLVITCLS